jgi:23S rRNA (guanine745-N1)-methyltransferase
VLPEVVDLLACPHCGAGLLLVDGSLRCETWHTFDFSRQGYVSLLEGPGTRGMGDTAAMVAARETFLEAGHFAPLATEVGRVVRSAMADDVGGNVIDVGAGTGHYLATTLDRLPDSVGIALDLSKFAMRRAARAHPRIGAVRCDVWRSLPLRSGVAGLALNVFAPRNAPEIQRVLRPGGALLVVTPTTRHLAELVTGLNLLSVDELKQARLEHKLDPYFFTARRTVNEFSMELNHSDIEALVTMGPSAWHKEEESLRERIKGLPEPLLVTASVVVSLYRRRDVTIA